MSEVEHPKKLRWRRPLLLASIILSSTAVLILFLFDPAESPFYPRCMFKSVTGFDCPGCGGLRAVHQLLHGNLGAAIALNPLVIFLSPIGGWFALSGLMKLAVDRSLPNPFRSPIWAWGFAATVVLFTVLRNIPW